VRASLDRIGHLVRKELLQAFRDPRFLRIIFVAPLIQLIVFGYAVSTDVRGVRTIALDRDQSRTSRELLSSLGASGRFAVVMRAEGPGEILDALDRGKALMGIEIPRGFARDLAQGDAAVQLLFDGTSSNTVTIARGYAERIVAGFGARTQARTLPGAGPGVDFRPRAWFNPDLESRNYNVPAVMGLILLLACLLLTALAVVREKELGTLEQLRVSPLRAHELIAGKTIPFALVGLVDLLIITTASLLWFRVPFAGNFLWLLLASGLYIMSGLGLGLLISTFSSTQQEAFMVSFLLLMPSILLSGFMFPVSSMPVVFRYLTLLNPLRHYIEIVRGIFLKGTGPEATLLQHGALLTMGAVVFLLASLRFRRS
jgi:ABC-2 type transport system permease protein